MSNVVRPGSGADSAAMGRIYCEAWQAAYRGIVSEEFLGGLTPENCAPSPERISPDNCLVCEKDGEVVGLLNITFDGDDGFAEIRTIYVRPDYWSTGAGRLLFEAAKEAIAKAGYRGVFLWTLTQNARARRFYERMGMRAAGERHIDIAGQKLPETQYVLAFE